MHEHPPVALADAVEHVYYVLRRYGLKAHIEGCPCCVFDEDQQRVRHRSLRTLTAEDLELYAADALLTWGDADDFRHFLPRLLELVTGSPDDEINNEILLSKLAYANWWEWPQQERDAIEAVLQLRWELGLTLDPSEFDADTWLCGVALAGSDSSRYIDAWHTSTAHTAFEHLATFLTSNRDLLTEGRLTNAFYPEDPADYPGHPAEDVAREMREWLDACMADAQFQNRLAAWYQQSD